MLIRQRTTREHSNSRRPVALRGLLIERLTGPARRSRRCVEQRIGSSSRSVLSTGMRGRGRFEVDYASANAKRICRSPKLSWGLTPDRGHAAGAADHLRPRCPHRVRDEFAVRTTVAPLLEHEPRGIEVLQSILPAGISRCTRRPVAAHAGARRSVSQYGCPCSKEVSPDTHVALDLGAS